MYIEREEKLHMASCTISVRVDEGRNSDTKTGQHGLETLYESCGGEHA